MSWDTWVPGRTHNPASHPGIGEPLRCETIEAQRFQPHTPCEHTLWGGEREREAKGKHTQPPVAASVSKVQELPWAWWARVATTPRL